MQEVVISEVRVVDNESMIVPPMHALEKIECYSSGTGDRFAREGRAHFRQFIHAAFLAWLLISSSDLAAGAELKLTARRPTGENVDVDAPLRLTFDRTPALGDKGSIEVCRVADGQRVETITV